MAHIPSRSVQGHAPVWGRIALRKTNLLYVCRWLHLQTGRHGFCDVRLVDPDPDAGGEVLRSNLQQARDDFGAFSDGVRTACPEMTARGRIRWRWQLPFSQNTARPPANRGLKLEAVAAFVGGEHIAVPTLGKPGIKASSRDTGRMRLEHLDTTPWRGGTTRLEGDPG